MKRNTRFGLHLLITAIIAAIAGIVNQILLESWTIIFTISIWLCGMSIVFWFNQHDARINGFILAPFLPLIVIESWIMGVGIWYDFIHLPTIAAGVFILWKRREHVRLLHVLFSLLIMINWAITVTLAELAYVHEFFITFDGHVLQLYLYPMFPLPTFLNIILLYWLLKDVKSTHPIFAKG